MPLKFLLRPLRQRLKLAVQDTPPTVGLGPGVDDDDLAYMRSLAAAVEQRTPRYMATVVGILALALLALVLWMGWAEIDEVVRGGGKVIPSRQVQVIQSLEGGVVSEILVREGDLVDLGQPLMKISDIAFASSYGENRLHYLELRAKIARLTAEAEGAEWVGDPEVSAEAPALMYAERSLFESNREQLAETLQIFEERQHQAESELAAAEAKRKQLTKSLELIRQEIQIKQPLVKSRLISEVEFLQLRGRETEMAGELEAVELSIPRLRSAIEEARGKVTQTRLDFRNQAKKELNEVRGEAARIAESQQAIKDRVQRAILRSPVKGTVKRLHINTVGGVIRPGSDAVEVVPREDALLVEVRIKPSDIAHIHTDQRARIKFSAYDFAIHGSLGGELAFVSADTITNEDGESFYLARVRPDRAYLGPAAQPLPIKVGMTAEVDILTGKKTILEYVMKPIARGMGNALGEQ